MNRAYFAETQGGCGVCERPGGLELTDRALALAQLPAGARVLDVGCGLGTTVAYLVDRCGLRAVGLDASLARVADARTARPDLDFVEGRAERLPFDDGSFDAATAECVLSTLIDPASALAELRRVLGGGGVLLLTDLYGLTGEEETAAAEAKRTGGTRDSGAHPPRLPSLGSRKGVEGLVADAGFSVEAWTDESGALARLLWDLSGSTASTPATAGVAEPGQAARRVRGAASAHRLGYFICVARASGERSSDSAQGDERA